MSKKEKNDVIKKALESSKNSYAEKIAILRYITKTNSKNISSVVANTLKNKK